MSDVQVVCCPGEMQIFRDCHKIAKLPDIEHSKTSGFYLASRLNHIVSLLDEINKRAHLFIC